MTKEEYIGKLQEKLQKFSKDLQNEIVDDYMQHFAEGEQLGKSDEDIISELGNIDDMIGELPEEECVEEPQIKVEEIELVREKNSSNLSACTGIVIEGRVADVYVEESVDGRIYVDYQNNSDEQGMYKYEFYQYEQEGVFYAGVKRREGVSGNKVKQISFFGRTISFENMLQDDSNVKINLRVRVPKDMQNVTVKTSSGAIFFTGVSMGAVTINTSSGNMDLRRIKAETLKLNTASGEAKIIDAEFGTLKINSASGDISMSQINGKTVQMNTASGDITLNTVRADSVQVNTASGDMTMFDVEAETLRANAASGDIEGKRVVARSNMHFGTASGDVEIDGSTKQAHFGTVSGDIDFKCQCPIESVTTNTVSGDVDLNLQYITGMEIEVKSKSGDVDIDWKGVNCCVKNAKSTFGDGSCNVNVSTSSGDVKIVA